jgi:predicted deacetylase
MLPSFTVLLRDVAPSTWPRCLRVLAAVREVAAVPVTLLVVPRLHGQPRDARFDDALAWRRWLGDELALHGYMHEEDGPSRGLLDALRRRLDGARTEFRSLRCDDALQRLHAGMRWFAANGWPLAGFAAPGWSVGPGAWAALQLTPFLYALTRHGIHVLARDEELASHSVELRTRGALARSVSLAWHALPGRLGQDAAPLVRLELTPDAADHRAVRLAWQRCLHHHLNYRQAQTVERVVRAWQPTLGREAALPAGLPHPSSARV